MSIPIIFFHINNPRYLKYSLKQARYFNPGSEIFLLGDQKNDRYPFVTHVNAANFEGQAPAFASSYKHMTSNGYMYELNCFLRWFYVCDFCKQKGIEEFIYLDSDILAFEDFDKLVHLFGDVRIANTCDEMGVPAFTYFRSYSVIDEFCNYLLKSYNDPAMLARLEQLYQPFINDPEMLGGISDMVLFHLYFQDYPEGTLKVDLINNEIAIDACINREDGFEMEAGMKKIYWQDNIPYCKQIKSGKLIRFAVMHYQGHAKSFMRRDYIAGGYKAAILWEELDLKAKIKRLKTSFKDMVSVKA
jgi:hypothetical protein